MLHNNARYGVEAHSSHYVILLVTCSESVQGEGCVFGLLMQKNISPPVQSTGPVHQSSPVTVDCQAIPKSFLFFGENFLLLVCELFRANEMHSLLEVTEMLCSS